MNTLSRKLKTVCIGHTIILPIDSVFPPYITHRTKETGINGNIKKHDSITKGIAIAHINSLNNLLKTFFIIMIVIYTLLQYTVQGWYKALIENL